MGNGDKRSIKGDLKVVTVSGGGWSQRRRWGVLELR